MSLRKAAHLPAPPVLRAGISFDRKVRILLRLRKESASLPTAPTGQDNGAGMENTEEVTDSDIVSDTSQGVETVEDLKINERCGNVYENKGPWHACLVGEGAIKISDKVADILEAY